MRLRLALILLLSLVLPLGLAGPAGRALHEAGKQLRYGAQAGAAELADRARRTGATDDLNCTDGTGDPWPEGEGGENCTVEFTGYLTDTRCIGWINGEDNTNITTAAPNHTKACMLTCWDFATGYTIMEKVGEGDYRAKYRLDLVGSQEIIKLLSNLPAVGGSCKTKNITVTVRGTPTGPADWTYDETGITSSLYNGQPVGEHFATEVLWENDPYDCPGHTKRPYPPVTGEEGGEEGGEGGASVAVTQKSTAGCTDLEGTDKTDSGGDDCGYYNWYPDDCGFFNDDDFTGAVLCCACDGGQASSAATEVDDGSTVAVAVGVSCAVVAIIAGVLAALYVRDKRAREREAKRAFVFDPMIQELREVGLLGNRSNSMSSATSVGAIEPIELTRHKLTMFEKIGSGQFGAVHRAEIPHPDAKGKLVVAVKLLKGADPSSAEREDFLKEAAITAQFNHENVVSLVGVVTTGLPYWIVLQFCADGSLRHVTKRLKLTAPPDMAWPQQFSSRLLGYCREIANGMRYLSARRFVHRDLAARNILVDGTTPKVSDFGLSRELEDENAVYYRSSNAATKLPIRWCAPEVINDLKFGEASDVWAFGITCCEVFTLGATPYSDMKNPELSVKVSKGGFHHPRPQNCPMRVWEDVIEPCFVTESKDRPSFVQILKKCMVVADAPGAFEATRDIAPNLYSTLDEHLRASVRHQKAGPRSEHTSPTLDKDFNVLDEATTTSSMATPQLSERGDSPESSLGLLLGKELNKLDAGTVASVGRTRTSDGSMHNYEGINTKLDPTLHRKAEAVVAPESEACLSAPEIKKWAQVVVNGSNDGIENGVVSADVKRCLSLREQGLPPPTYAGSPKFQSNMNSPPASVNPSARPSFANEHCHDYEELVRYEVPVRASNIVRSRRASAC